MNGKTGHSVKYVKNKTKTITFFSKNAKLTNQTISKIAVCGISKCANIQNLNKYKMSHMSVFKLLRLKMSITSAQMFSHYLSQRE